MAACCHVYSSPSLVRQTTCVHRKPTLYIEHRHATDSRSRTTPTEPRDAPHHADRVVHNAGRPVWSTCDGRRPTVDSTCNGRRVAAELSCCQKHSTLVLLSHRANFKSIYVMSFEKIKLLTYLLFISCLQKRFLYTFNCEIIFVVSKSMTTWHNAYLKCENFRGTRPF